MAEHNITGAKGEAQACQHLQSKGYILLEQNWRWSRAEVDIIAQHHNTLVVVEVKTRSTEAFGEVEQEVTLQQQKAIVKVANAYVEARELDLEVRFDIIAIVTTTGELKHIEDAFRAMP